MICIHNELGSTNVHLLNIINVTENQNIIKNFNTILALKQTAGYGKYKRNWEGYEGNLSMSFYLSSNKFDWIASNNISFLSILLGILLIEKLNSYFNKKEYFKLKYPNDIILNNKKVGGLLLETAIKDKDVNLICGIGLNLLHYPHFIENTTSIYNETNKKIESILFAEEIMDVIKTELYPRINDKSQIIKDFMQHSFLKKDDKITIQLSNKTQVSGTYQSLSSDASLNLLLPNNQIIKISHGDIFI